MDSRPELCETLAMNLFSPTTFSLCFTTPRGFLMVMGKTLKQFSTSSQKSVGALGLEYPH
ncbi:hypothetical protein FB451DRAFT_1369704, partial [Mycena latifolia]